MIILGSFTSTVFFLLELIHTPDSFNSCIPESRVYTKYVKLYLKNVYIRRWYSATSFWVSFCQFYWRGWRKAAGERWCVTKWRPRYTPWPWSTSPHSATHSYHISWVHSKDCHQNINITWRSFHLIRSVLVFMLFYFTPNIIRVCYTNELIKPISS